MANVDNARSAAASNGRHVVVFGDIHGDLDILARSLAEMGLVRYDGELDPLIGSIREHLLSPYVPELERIVIPQDPPVKLVLVGDLVDRFPHAYHVLQFVSKIRWERYGIELTTLLGNHDLMNLMFFTNPLEVHQLMTEAGRPKEEIMQYIGGMGLAESLQSFHDLHQQELMELQSRFYADSRLEFPAEGHSVVFSYPRDLSWFADPPPICETSMRKRKDILGTETELSASDIGHYLEEAVTALGVDGALADRWGKPDSLNALVQCMFDLLGELVGEGGERNWWRIFWRDDERWFGYSPEINGFNAFIRQVDKRTHQLMPIDWRLISMVWRRHYGDYFRRTRVLHLEGDTLFTHGGISPLAMFDPLFFGSLYHPNEDVFRDIGELSEVSLQSFVDRTNRLVSQIIENSLNDYSFARMCGAELLDQMGNRRGSSEGLPEFGGPLWADFDFLKERLLDSDSDRLRRLYSAFSEATGVRRIVCGHTVFLSWSEPEMRFRKIDTLDELGIEFVCVDNGCSRAYRWHDPVTTGIAFSIQEAEDPNDDTIEASIPEGDDLSSGESPKPTSGQAVLGGDGDGGEVAALSSAQDGLPVTAAGADPAAEGEDATPTDDIGLADGTLRLACRAEVDDAPPAEEPKEDARVDVPEPVGEASEAEAEPEEAAPKKRDAKGKGRASRSRAGASQDPKPRRRKRKTRKRTSETD